jgi:hypothetical protein
MVDATSAVVFATPLAPSESQTYQHSPAAIQAAAADGYFQAAAAGTARPAGIFSDAELPESHEDQPDALPLPAIDAILADGLLDGEHWAGERWA